VKSEKLKVKARSAGRAIGKISLPETFPARPEKKIPVVARRRRLTGYDDLIHIQSKDDLSFSSV
jgi:hypothetical protein